MISTEPSYFSEEVLGKLVANFGAFRILGLSWAPWDWRQAESLGRDTVTPEKPGLYACGDGDAMEVEKPVMPWEN